MGAATATADEPSNTGQILAALERLAHEKRLSTLASVAQLIGLNEIETEHSRRTLTNSFRSLEWALADLDRQDGNQELRSAILDAWPHFTSSQVDAFVDERLGGRR